MPLLPNKCDHLKPFASIILFSEFCEKIRQKSRTHFLLYFSDGKNVRSICLAVRRLCGEQMLAPSQDISRHHSSMDNMSESVPHEGGSPSRFRG